MSDAYLRDMLEDPALDPAAGTGEVASFYAGCNVLITGASGFLGKLSTEKILRSCSDVNTLFLLLRAKKGKTPAERFEELFDDVIFDRLKKEKSEFSRKVMLIEGDMAQADLGLSQENRELLRTTHIVLHGAAAVRFVEKLRMAANINLRGVQELLFLAKEMPNLKAFVHVSTAYSNCVSDVIEEKYYQPPFDADKLFSLLDILDDASLDHLTPVLLGKWPNRYFFTKAIAEDIIRRNCQNLPLYIVRPSVVTATSKEPIAGWINNVYGVTGIVVAAGIGLSRTQYCDRELVANIIPADYVVNNIIVAAWDTAKLQSQKVNSTGSSMVPKDEESSMIYNAVSSNQRPITWGQLMKYTEEYGMSIPSTMCLWYYCFRLNKYRWVHNLSVIFLHFIPAAIVDSWAWLTGRKPTLWATYKRIHKFSSVIEFFMLHQWRFDNTNVQELWKRLSPVDRSEFDLDIGSIDWRDYCFHQVRGLRIYLLKDPLDTLPQGHAKYARLKVAHYTLVTAACGILLWLVWTVVRFIGLW